MRNTHHWESGFFEPSPKPDVGYSEDTYKRRCGIALAALTVLLAVVIAVLILWPRPVPMCTLRKPPDTHVSYVFDASDPFSEAQWSKLENEVYRRMQALNAGDRISLMAIRPATDGGPLVERFNLCKPRDGSDAHWLWDNKKMLRDTYRRSFELPFNQALDALAKSKDANTSPILEAISALASDPTFSPQVQNRELVLVSDGLQNSALANFFRGESSYETLANSGSAYLSNVEMLAGTCTTMYLIRNQYENRQGAELMQFWKDYWNHAAGTSCYELRRL